MRRWSGGISALLVLAATIALAQLWPEPDFAPFTMRITGWTAAAFGREGEAPQPGTSVQLLQYRSRHSWSVTVLGSSWDPAQVGMKVEMDSGTHSTFFPPAQRLFSSSIPGDEVGRVAPLPWIFPGLLDGLSSSRLYERLPGSARGTVAFTRRGGVTSTRPDGTVEVVDGILLVFDVASGLPVITRTYVDGSLVESVTYEVVSRP